MFSFTANGETLVVTKEDILNARFNEMFEDGLTDMTTAMSIANRKLLWGPYFRDGMWQEGNSENEYVWVEGYFFD